MNNTNHCPCCGKLRTYKNEKNAVLFKDKNCRSCANSISRGGDGNVKSKNGFKKCFDCKKTLNVSNFYQNKDGRLHSVCRTCSLNRSREYHKNHYRFNKYDLSKEEFEEMKELQDNKCATCKKEKELYIDHCHSTQKVRGLLCRECNSAIGLLDESLETITNVINYLTNE